MNYPHTIETWDPSLEGRPAYSDGMGTLFIGRLVDPVTGRHAVTCEACGTPRWFDRGPGGHIVVSTLCHECASHCAVCREEIIPGRNVVAWPEPDGNFAGRPVCDGCYTSGAAEEARR